MKVKYFVQLSVLIIAVAILSCAGEHNDGRDIIHDPFTEEQAEIRKAINAIVMDAESANAEGLKAIHLVSDKFTKFGPRNFNRQDLAQTNASEEKFFTSISNYKQEVKDLKIDVFGDVAVATYYPYVSFVQKWRAEIWKWSTDLRLC